MRHCSFIPVVGLALLALAAPLHADDLLDYVIQAVDPTLAPARPLIECLAGGGSAEHCAAQAAQQQAAGALSIGPGDDRVQLAAKVFIAASEEDWAKVLSVGGVAIAKFVSCAMLPLQGPLKQPACDILGWVISGNAKVLDQAWQALTGPDWWALVDVAGSAVCELIPAEGAAAYAKDVLCGPLAAVLLQVKQWADAVGNAVVAGADAVENLVFGDDSHMPYDRYFALYWQPWYHYSTARIWQGQGLGPAVSNVQGNCVDYFDSHNQYRSTAKKTCGDMRKKFDRHVQGFAAALPVAVDGYFETIARPAIRGFARHNYGKPAPAPLPGQELFVSNCVFQIRKRFPFPEPDEFACDLVAEKAEQYKNTLAAGMAFSALAKVCYSNVQQQTLNPTVWQLACDELRPRYGQVFAGESLKLMTIIGDLKAGGCQLIDPKQAGKLLFECPAYGAYARCLESLLPNGKQHCVLPALKISDTLDVQPSIDAGAGPVAAAAGVAVQAPQSGRAAQAVPAQRQVVPAAPAVLPPPQPGQPATGFMPRAPDAFEAERLLAAGKVEVRGGQAVAQDMAGFGPGWSGNAQLFWHGGAVGATLDLLVDVPDDGAWAVEIALTRAPDYGQLAFEVDQHPVRQRFDGYAPQVAGPVAVALGSFAMQRGLRRISLKIEGRNAAASGWLAGVDRIVLKPAGGR
ncbi:MAG: hypothetical protein MUE63_02225 [Xanthomonadales bacterium]|jgi:hypothetical protein|nr:hypothetical protein [Xanthomonadales bacterium]